MMRAPAVDIIVPVYRGLAETRDCIESVLAFPQKTKFGLIVIDDCTPEPALADWLDRMAGQGRFSLLRNIGNLGFVRTVNRGMELHPDRDVLLLNSDAQVANDWLDRMADCAYAGTRIATVTPFSNNATICSYPGLCEENELPADMDVAGLDVIFAKVNRGKTVELPTGVGFCLYVRRAAINEVGLFDADNFGKGYGEENDFCQKAVRRGWRNVLAADVFVRHTGGVSFGAEQAKRKENATAVLTRLHPNYADDVRKFIAADPVLPFRLAVDFFRVAKAGLPVILAISHHRGGGTQKHMDDLAALLIDRARCLLLRPLTGGRAELRWHRSGEALTLNFDTESDHDLLLETLDTLGVCRVHVHSLVDVPDRWLNIAQALNVPCDFTIHDYFTVCPKIYLNYGSGSRYCGELGSAQCTACLKKSPAHKRTRISDWRSRSAGILVGADRIFVPSRDAGTRLARHFPRVAVMPAPHPEPGGVFPRPRMPARLAANAALRVFVLGALNEAKGGDFLEACAIDAAQRKLPLQFGLIGYAYRTLKTSPAASLQIHGRYDDNELQALIAEYKPDLVWFPALSPETYSYTFSAALAAGSPVAAPDIGAFAERAEGRPWSWIYDWRMTPAVMNDWLVSLRTAHFLGATEAASPAQTTADPRAVFDYRRDYASPAGAGRRSGAADEAFLRLAAKIIERDCHAQPKENSWAAGAIRFFHVIKYNKWLSGVVRKIPAHYQHQLKDFLLNTRLGCGRKNVPDRRRPNVEGASRLDNDGN